MKKWLGLALALVLVLAVAGAWVEEIQGKVRTVDPSDRSIVLEDGTQVWVAEGLPMDAVKEGAPVKISYEERDGKKVATALEVAE